MSSFVVTEDSLLLSAANENADSRGRVAEGLEVKEITAAEAGDPSAANNPDWVAVETPRGQKGFLKRVILRAPQSAPVEIGQELFFDLSSVQARLPSSETDHHYLFALAFAESAVSNAPASPGSDATGPFKYSVERWAELVREHGSATGLTADDRTSWQKQVEMAAREACSDAGKIETLMGRTAQYNELYVSHVLGAVGGNAVLVAAKDNPQTPVEVVLQQAQVAADATARLSAAHPNLLGGTVANALDAAAATLSHGFDEAAKLGLARDPPEMQPDTPPSGTSVAPRTGGNVAQFQAQARRVLDFFVRSGMEWSKAQVTGIIANIYAESRFNPNIPGDGGQAYGLCQWHSDRQKNFFQNFGGSIKNAGFERQLQFIDFELHNGEQDAGNRLRREMTPDGAGSVVSLHYERPAGKEAEARRRAEIALQFAAILV